MNQRCEWIAGSYAYRRGSDGLVPPSPSTGRACGQALWCTHHPYAGVLRGEGGAEVRRPHATLPSWRAYAGSDAVHDHHRHWWCEGVKHSSRVLDRALPEVVVKRVIPTVASARQPPDACAWKLRSHGMAAKVRGYGGVLRVKARRPHATLPSWRAYASPTASCPPTTPMM